MPSEYSTLGYDQQVVVSKAAAGQRVERALLTATAERGVEVKTAVAAVVAVAVVAAATVAVHLVGEVDEMETEEQ